jgi:hypothetical protein
MAKLESPQGPQQIVTLYDDQGYPQAAQVANWTGVAAGQVIKNGPGRLVKIVILTAFTGAGTLFTVYDNATGAASGTPLFALGVASGANAGGQVFDVNLPCANGISVVGSGGTFTAGVIGFGYS